jgi:pSer/pThr/pTyr-binding forkhead associated (FHA) protein
MSTQQAAQHQREARLRIVLPTGDVNECVLMTDKCFIGRGEHNDIVINDPEVSPTHALLRSYGDSYYILDEGGENGTFVNGEKVVIPSMISHGDIIKMGQSLIIFNLKLGADAPEAVFARAATPDATDPIATPPADRVSEAGKEKKKPKTGESHPQADSVTEAQTSSNDDGSEERRKKKKDKKLDKGKVDERVKAARVRAWGGIIATVLSVVLTVTISILVTRTGSNQQSVQVVPGGARASKKLAHPSDIRTITGGKYEASGSAAVRDANGILFVDDSKPDHIFYMPVNELGVQDGPVKAIPLGVSIENPEGITQFGKQYIIIGSLSTPESNDKGGLATFNFDPATQTVSKAMVLTGMRKFLFDNVPELKAWADKASLDGGLNVEGLAYDPDPQHPRMLLGLRGPVLNGRALVVPIRRRDREAPFAVENLELDEPNAIQLNLDGQAIRGMVFDPRLRAFLIISGAPETQEKTTFTLWEWNGDGDQGREDARPKIQTLLDKKMKPEGVAHLKIANQEFVFVVGDASCYTRIDYLTP